MKSVIKLAIFILILFATGISYAQRKGKTASTHRPKNLNQSEYYFTEGMKFYILESYSKAIELFLRSLELNQESSGVNYTIAEAYARSGKYVEALKYAEKALVLDETNKYNFLLVAHLYEQEKKYSQAIKIYQEMFKKLPDADEYYFELAAIYSYQNKYEDALKIYDKIEKKFGISEDVSLAKQKIFLKNSKIDLAIEESKKLIKQFPGDEKYSIFLSELLLSNKRKPEAILILEDLIKRNPEQSEARVLLSELYRDRGDGSKANSEMEKAFSNPEMGLDTKARMLAEYLQNVKSSESLQNAKRWSELLIKIHPDKGQAYALYGSVLKLSGDTQKARDNFIKATDLGVSDFEIWKEIVELDAQLSEFDKVILNSEQAMVLYPNNNIFYYFNGFAHLARKEYKESVEILEMGKSLSKDNNEMLNQFNGMLGDAYNGINNYKKSDEAYDLVLKNDPNNDLILNNYSYYLSLRKEKLDKAKEMSAKLIDRHPNNSSYLDTHAWVLYMLKDYINAKKNLEKALKFSSTNGTILEHYGDVLFKLGEKDKAVDQWIKAKNAGDTSTVLEKKIADKVLYEK